MPNVFPLMFTYFPTNIPNVLKLKYNLNLIEFYDKCLSNLKLIHAHSIKGIIEILYPFCLIKIEKSRMINLHTYKIIFLKTFFNNKNSKLKFDGIKLV